MFARAIFAFLALPGLFAGILPWTLSQLDPWHGNGQHSGFFPLTVGLLLLLWCVRDFYVAGKGTLAPWNPPRHLVTIGLYRFTRNPMYLSVFIIIASWGLIYASPLTAAYLLFFMCAFHLRVILNEEVWLSKQFPEHWNNYRDSVPRWLPGFSRIYHVVNNFSAHDKTP